MKNKVRNITYTAVLLALLICLQWAGSQIALPMAKQLVTGSFVNCVLAVAALTVGTWGGVALALISPVMAFLLGIAPNFITVLPIMAANTVYVLMIRFVAGKEMKLDGRKMAAVLSASVAKFFLLYLLVVQVVCNLAAPSLLGKKLGDIVVLAPPMLQMLPAMFSWPQLVTALVGGAVAVALLPLLKKAVKH